MILADAHLHLFHHGYPGIYGRSQLGLDVDVYESLRMVHGVKSGLVVGYEGEGIDPGNNVYIRSLAADRPWMATVAYAGVHSAPSAEAVSALLDSGHVGIALYVADGAGAKAAIAWQVRTWRVLHQGRAIVSLNVAPEHTLIFAPIIKAHFGCTFLVSHMGLPGSYKSPPGLADAEARLAPLLHLAELPNVMVKISAPYAISDPPHAYPHLAAEPFMSIILNHFGAERCLWGSDFSPALDHVSFAQTVSNPWLERLDDGDRALVMGENLLRLLDRLR